MAHAGRPGCNYSGIKSGSAWKRSINRSAAVRREARGRTPVISASPRAINAQRRWQQLIVVVLTEA